jgi:hypothetical protein
MGKRRILWRRAEKIASFPILKSIFHLSEHWVELGKNVVGLGASLVASVTGFRWEGLGVFGIRLPVMAE